MENKPSLQQNCLCFFANKNFVFITKQGAKLASLCLAKQAGLSIKNKIFYFL
jgi:hypothetical protein